MAADHATPDDATPNRTDERLDFALRVGGADSERVIFFLAGHLLASVCPGFENFTRSCIDGGTRRLRLDLADLRSLDLDGVNALLSVHERLAFSGGRLVLTNANAQVMAVLRLFAQPLLASETSVVLGAGAGRTAERTRPGLGSTRAVSTRAVPTRAVSTRAGSRQSLTG
jgi:anti-anti-sigma regulatory factor